MNMETAPTYPYEKDTPAEREIEAIVSEKIKPILQEFTKETGEGGIIISDRKKFAEAIEKLINEITADKKYNKESTEKVVMRKVLMYSPVRSNLVEVLENLPLDEETTNLILDTQEFGKLKDM